MEINKEKLANQLLGYMMHSGLTLRRLSKKMGICIETLNGFIYNKTAPRLDTLLRINSFLTDNYVSKMVIKPVSIHRLSVMQTCEIHNRIRALPGNVADNLIKFLDKLEVFELDEITAPMYKQALIVLDKMSKDYER